MSNLYQFRRTASLGAALTMMLAALMIPVDALQGPAPGSCRISGHVTAGTSPLPGVAIAVKSGEALRVATS
ncbi:MAG TPA: hypothetical protein VEL79_08255, partial [Vicinamibacterales bacterium]|nr:hypothetical protein [Vicinamibacterales bacterium]